jgi:RNase P subunit RPR2
MHKIEKTPQIEKSSKKTKKEIKNSIAFQRIERLLELAEKEEKYYKEYAALAKKISERTRTRMTAEQKKKFCKKCFSKKISKREEKTFEIIKCAECGFEKRFRK